MNYLLAPMHTHRDSGFGATGNAFKAAAEHLDASQEYKKDGLFGSQLPTNYLYRHAIELHLKSAIVIFHRRFKMSYGEAPFDGDPRVLVGDKWKLFREVHSIESLWAYVRSLFEKHGEWLAKNTKCDWTIAPETGDWVKVVHAGDPRSTFFRYPTTTDLECDAVKSPMKAVSAEDFLKKFTAAKAGDQKGFAMIVENENKEFVHGYLHEATDDKVFGEPLRELSEFCYNLHAAMRWELCDGW